MVEDNLDIHALRFINAVAGDVLESFQFTLLCYWFATHETLYSVIHFTHSCMVMGLQSTSHNHSRS